RLRPIKTADGGFIVDDSYNANPSSVQAALDFMATLEAPKGAILGDMLELGDDTKLFHQKVGTWAAKADLDYLALVGDLMAEAKKAALDEGMADEKVELFSDPLKAAQWIIEVSPKRSVTLIKASHSVGLDRAATFLLAQKQNMMKENNLRNAL
ncbi:MAG: UDP-N-acetylmuramoyl-tripeptide--D-alanyl-D-alanine ligase, partial [Deltaproteobacteria bacterium]|nr:UDP-N-acetylmuramoyl-tripeptide--D-alanyl-D-alanine ligase [Deltaproteobacteria bacterium]